jgi:hypothetical protein
VKGKRRPKPKPAATPDDLIATGVEGRIRMIAKRSLKRRRKTKPA